MYGSMNLLYVSICYTCKKNYVPIFSFICLNKIESSVYIHVLIYILSLYFMHVFQICFECQIYFMLFRYFFYFIIINELYVSSCEMINNNYYFLAFKRSLVRTPTLAAAIKNRTWQKSSHSVRYWTLKWRRKSSSQ